MSERVRELLIWAIGVGLVVLAATLTDRIFEAVYDPTGPCWRRWSLASPQLLPNDRWAIRILPSC